MSSGTCARCGLLSYHLTQTPQGAMHRNCWAREQAEALAQANPAELPAPQRAGETVSTEPRRYTIAVDFDGVLHQYITPWSDARTIADPPVPGAMEWLKTVLERYNVVIYSSRLPDGLPEMRAWFDRWGGDELTDRLAFWTGSKPTALVYLDDRAMRFHGRWPSFEELEQRPWKHEDKPQAPLNVIRPATRDNAFLDVNDIVVGFDEQEGIPVLVVDPLSGFGEGLIPKARYRLTREAAAEVGALLLAASVDPKETRKLLQEALVQKALAKESP